MGIVITYVTVKTKDHFSSFIHLICASKQAAERVIEDPPSPDYSKTKKYEK